jgi:biotin carboxyl carrier protein
MHTTKENPLEIKAKMPGKVLSIKVNAGDAVTKGQRIIILEAMKMETPIPCPCDGTVGEVKVSVGNKVSPGQVLMVIEE